MFFLVFFGVHINSKIVMTDFDSLWSRFRQGSKNINTFLHTKSLFISTHVYFHLPLSIYLFIFTSFHIHLYIHQSLFLLLLIFWNQCGFLTNNIKRNRLRPNNTTSACNIGPDTSRNVFCIHLI